MLATLRLHITSDILKFKATRIKNIVVLLDWKLYNQVSTTYIKEGQTENNKNIKISYAYKL